MQEKIREIVATFELPRGIEERVVFAANNALEILCLTDYSSLYRYVASVVEKYQQPWEERIALSLDAPISGDDDRLRHELIGDRGQVSDDLPLMPLEEALNLSASYMDARQRGVVKELVKRAGLYGRTKEEYLTLAPEEVIADFLGIKYRSVETMGMLERDARFRHPERSMATVKIVDGKLRITFGNRRYAGNPLGYLRRNGGVYEEALRRGRWALQKFDPGLYAALLKCAAKGHGESTRQIDIAIPDVKPAGRKEYGGEMQTRIIEAHLRYKGNAHEASRRSTHSVKTVLKYWRRAGLEVKVGGPRKVSDRDEKRIVDAYAKYGGSAYQAVRHLPFNHQTVIRYWKEHGLPILGRGENPAKTLNEEKQERIVAAHETHFGNAKEAARKLGCSPGAVRKYWRKAGLEPKGHGTRNLYPSDLRRKVLDAYELYDGNAELTASELGASATNVRRIWKENGLRAKGKGGWPKGVSRQEMNG